jgi:hypothetical protein
MKISHFNIPAVAGSVRDEAIGFSNWLNASSRTMALGGKGQPAHKADILIAICEPNVENMWEPRRLTNLWASTACYCDSFTYTIFVLRKNIRSKMDLVKTCRIETVKLIMFCCCWRLTPQWAYTACYRDNFTVTWSHSSCNIVESSYYKQCTRFASVVLQGTWSSERIKGLKFCRPMQTHWYWCGDYNVLFKLERSDKFFGKLQNVELILWSSVVTV